MGYCCLITTNSWKDIAHAMTTTPRDTIQTDGECECVRLCVCLSVWKNSNNMQFGIPTQGLWLEPQDHHGGLHRGILCPVWICCLHASHLWFAI